MEKELEVRVNDGVFGGSVSDFEPYSFGAYSRSQSCFLRYYHAHTCYNRGIIGGRRWGL